MLTKYLYRPLLSNIKSIILTHQPVKVNYKVYLKNKFPISCIYSPYSNKSPVDETTSNVKTHDKINETGGKVVDSDTKFSSDPVSNYKEDDFETKFWDAHRREHKMKETNLYSDKIAFRKVYTNPHKRVIGIVKDEVMEYFGKLKHKTVVPIKDTSLIDKEETLKWRKTEIFPAYCDVVIIGGGLIGTSIAYHLQERAGEALNIVVVEKDLSYSRSSSLLSVGGIRQQFSLPENIVLSRYGMDFLQQAPTALALDGKPPPKFDVNFGGYLTLASENQVPQLLESYKTQIDHRSFVKLLTKDKIKEKFPWIETDGIEAGIYGTQREGWFDQWSLLLALNRKTASLGTRFVNGTVVGGRSDPIVDYIHAADSDSCVKQVQNVKVSLPNGEERDINCAHCVIAAGAWSKDIGLMLGIGSSSSGVMSVPIPVEPRRRSVYCFTAPNGPGLTCPLVVDPNGTYFRREGLADQYLCGRAPTEEPPVDFSVDNAYFEENILPTLSHRCSSFKNLKMNHSWSGYYDYNTYDQNPIIDRHPLFVNLFMATGFSGHGVQHAAGTGKAMTELILDGRLSTLDIENFGMDRLFVNKHMHEKYII